MPKDGHFFINKRNTFYSIIIEHCEQISFIGMNIKGGTKESLDVIEKHQIIYVHFIFFPPF
jgi:hypothetical protein